MELVEQAQRLLDQAAVEVSDVAYGAREWRRLGRLYDLVYAEWYRLRDLGWDPRIELDADVAKAPAGPDVE
jgi:hypothetical protein